MRFPKATRELLRVSGGKPVEIPWPTGGPEPRPHRVYTVQSSHRAGESKVVVLFVADDAERAIVRVDADPVRLLGKSGGSTERVAGAIKTRQAPPQDDSIRWGTEFEPERLSVEDEAEVVRAAHDRRNQGIREKIARAEEAISGLLDDGAAASDIRFHRGLLAKLEGKLTREEATDRAAA